MTDARFISAPTGDVLRVVSPTEERNPRTADIDKLSALELLRCLNDEDATVALAVRAVLPELAEVVEVTVRRLEAGGRVHYFGAGTSGRLAMLDAVELPPTFGVGPELFTAHLAGGDGAMRSAREGVEDDGLQGVREAADVTADDVVIGIASSGYTAYVGGALQHANSVGAYTALITSNPTAPLAAVARTVLCVETGPEAITGSTRMKSGTAQKLVLNSFSTAVMVRSGRTWSNLMVDLTPTNAKLQGRLVNLLRQATGQDEASCERALAEAGNEPKTALLTLLAGVAPERARAELTAAHGRVAAALESIQAG